MKTLEKLYKEIQADSELKKEYVKAAKDKKIIDFMKAHDCDATEAEVESFIKAKNEKSKELADDELDMVSGGGACTTYNVGGWPIVTELNSCKHYRASKNDTGYCIDCLHSGFSGLSLICYCPQRHESVDDI